MTVSRLEPAASLSYKAGRGSDKVNEKLSSYRKKSEIIGLRYEKLPRRVSFIDFLRDDKKKNTEEKWTGKDSSPSEIGLQELLRNIKM